MVVAHMCNRFVCMLISKYVDMAICGDADMRYGKMLTSWCANMLICEDGNMV